MKSYIHSSRNLRSIFVFTFLFLLVSTGCGRVRRFLSRLHVEHVNYHSVTIGWTPAKPEVAGYNVYREWQFSGPIRLTPQIVQGSQYVDKTAIAGHTYTYYVTSVDSGGLESKPSESISVNVPK
jgi:fibronectin type 3 domain-containing protein